MKNYFGLEKESPTIRNKTWRNKDELKKLDIKEYIL